MEWGCDAPAPQPVFEIGCPRCDGGDAKCALCNGTGAQRIYRCPAAIAKTDPMVLSILEAYIALERYHTWPAAGGYGDQSPYFAACVRLIDAERGRIPPPKRGG